MPAAGSASGGSRSGINPASETLKKHSRDQDRLLREAILDVLPRLRRFAVSLTGNRHDADDLLQSTVERVLTRAVPADADMAKWMFRVLRNLWIDEIRARDVRLKAAARPDWQNDGIVSGEDAVLGELTLRDVDRAMSNLPEEQREVVSLVAVEGFSYREAAEVLDVPIGTVMSRLARARAGLAKALGDKEAAKPAARAGQGDGNDG